MGGKWIPVLQHMQPMQLPLCPLSLMVDEKKPKDEKSYQR
jgi:hypothetical protein